MYCLIGSNKCKNPLKHWSLSLPIPVEIGKAPELCATSSPSSYLKVGELSQSSLSNASNIAVVVATP
jgi:hypothetical protein